MQMLLLQAKTSKIRLKSVKSTRLFTYHWSGAF